MCAKIRIFPLLSKLLWIILLFLGVCRFSSCILVKVKGAFGYMQLPKDTLSKSCQ